MLGRSTAHRGPRCHVRSSSQFALPDTNVGIEPDRADDQESLPIAQKQAGWSRLHMTYLSMSDDDVRTAMRDVTV